MYVPFCKSADDVTIRLSLHHHFWPRLKKLWSITKGASFLNNTRLAPPFHHVLSFMHFPANAHQSRLHWKILTFTLKWKYDLNRIHRYQMLVYFHFTTRLLLPRYFKRSIPFCFPISIIAYMSRFCILPYSQSYPYKITICQEWPACHTHEVGCHWMSLDVTGWQATRPVSREKLLWHHRLTRQNSNVVPVFTKTR